MQTETTVAGRLGTLIGDGEDKTMSIRRFAEAMTNRDPRPPGSTRAMIHRYLKAEGPEPPAEFLAAAAEVLGVNPAWLAWGRGHPTEAHAAASKTSEEAQEESGERFKQEMGVSLKRAVFDSLGMGEVADQAGTPYWLAPLAEVWLRLFDPMELHGSGAHYPVPVWNRIAQALAEPLKALGVDPRMMHERGKLGDYVIAMIPPLMLLAEEWVRQFEWFENQPDYEELA